MLETDNKNQKYIVKDAKSEMVSRKLFFKTVTSIIECSIATLWWFLCSISFSLSLTFFAADRSKSNGDNEYKVTSTSNAITKSVNLNGSWSAIKSFHC